jgi:hypothetical protein
MVGGNVDCIKSWHSKTAVQNIISASPFPGQLAILRCLEVARGHHWEILAGPGSGCGLTNYTLCPVKWRGCRLKAGQIIKL